MTQKLSVQSARDLLPGQRLKDHIQQGLELRANGDGSKSWLYYYRAPDGTQRRPKFGAFPSISIEDARKRGRDIDLEVAQGRDPSAERAALRVAPTMNDLIELYLKVVVADKKPRTQEEYRRNIELHVRPRLGKLRVAEVTLAEIKACLAKVPGTAAPNRVRACLSGMFKLALHDDYKWRVGKNPVSDTVTKPERKRKRKAETAEFVRLAVELDKLAFEYPRQVAVIRVALMAGTRITELVEAKKSEMIGNKIVLTRHKNERTGEDREIVLPRQALDVIASLNSNGICADPCCPYIFGRGIGRWGNAAGPHLTRYNIKDIWNKAREAAGCPDLRAQDLRRTFASVAGSVGVGLDPVGQLFGHADPKTTRRYQWLYDDAGTANAQAVADKITTLMSGQPKTPGTFAGRFKFRRSRPTPTA